MITPSTMNDPISLNHALVAARAQLALAQPPAHVQAQLLAAFEREHGAAKPALLSSAVAPKPWWRGWRLAMLSSGGMGTAFAAFMAWALLTPYTLTEPPAAPTSISASGQFVALASRASIEAERQAGPTAWVLPGEVRGNQLAELGLPFDPARAAEPQRAELLVASSGDLLGVRLAN